VIDGLFDYGSMPVIEQTVRYTQARHRLLAHNIANLSTPHFEPVDVRPEVFREQLRKAVARRAATGDPMRGEIEFNGSGAVEQEFDGRLMLNPSPRRDGIMFHDRNNRDLERLMQDLAENTLTHNAALTMLKNQFDLIETAIRERV